MNNRFSTKQAFLFTVINYFGVLIGVVSTLFIYPKDKDLLGTFRFVDGLAQILYPIMVFGASTALLNFQPKLNPFLQRKLFSYSLISIVWMTVLCAAGLSMVYYFKWYSNKQYYIYAFFIAISLAYIDLFKRQATNLQKLAFPTFFEKIVPKLVLPLIFLAIFYFSTTETQGLRIYTFSFLLIITIIALYVFRHFKPVYSLNYNDLFQEISRKNYYQYSLYAFCASLGSFFAFRIDSVMIPHFISNEANGDFNIGVNLANALMIPAAGVFALYSPIISEALKKEEFKLLKVKYIDVAKNLFFVGILMYGCVILGIKDLFDLLPTAEQLAPTLPIIYLLGANVVLNMAMGFNTEIIAYSKYYRFNLIAILILAVLNIGLNYFILTQTPLGIVGIAYTSIFSITTFNVLKMWFIYRKFGLLPFNATYFKVVVCALALLVILHFIPIQNFIPFGFVLKCGLFAGLFAGICYHQKWVPQLNDFIDQFLLKFKK
ncbi:MAG TPA: polysaccharide biosynthesis C-terminal domain-containing protein [Flavobacterium sp.]|nr:polysaccharide biosynthesis C-terminal domain-containing protein [Flavobacterium sp.]